MTGITFFWNYLWKWNLRKSIFWENGFLRNWLHFFRNWFWEIFSLRARPWLSSAAAEHVSEHIVFSNIVTECSLRFIQSNYNSISRDPSIIQGFQVTTIICGQSWGMRAASYCTRTVQRLSPASSMVRDARRKFASLHSTMKTNDCLWSGKVFVYPCLLNPAIPVYR